MSQQGEERRGESGGAAMETEEGGEWVGEDGGRWRRDKGGG